MRSIMRITILIMLIVCLLVTPCSAQPVNNVQIIKASPGDTITFHGIGSPSSKVTMKISTSVTIDAHCSDGKWLYDLRLNNVHIPCGENSFSISACPVSTMTVWGSFHGLTTSRNAGVSGGRASFSISHVPSATYTIGVNGIANGSKVKLDVSASCSVCVDRNGNFSASVNTCGMPAGVYDVTQNGIEVAIVYLGVPGPVTPTPTPTICPTPTVCPTPGYPPTPPNFPCPPGRDDLGVTAAQTSDTMTNGSVADSNYIESPSLISVTVQPGQNGSTDTSLLDNLYDSGVTIGTVLIALAGCGITGAVAYLLLSRKK